MFVLMELEPLLTDGTRPTMRAAQAQDRRLTGAANQIWYPAITKAPSLNIKLFDGDFTSTIAAGTASFSISLLGLDLGGVDTAFCRWSSAPITISAVPSTDEVYVLSDGARVIDAFGSYVIDDLAADRVFVGRIDTYTIDGSTLTATASVDTSPFDKNVLTLTYAGTGGAEGGADLKDQVKPWIFGRAMNVEPKLINAVDNVYQFSAYGPIAAVNALYERGASFGASIGDYATYALLVAATIPEGRWGTCLAQGMVRLGAPPYGVITGDVDGDNHDGVWLRHTGEIIRRVALNAGVDVDLIADSIDELDVSVPYPVNIVLTNQESVLSLATRMVLPCNAQAGVSWLGQLFATRAVFGSPILTLDAQGRQLPAVTKSTEADVSPPYKRIQFGAARCWRVHTYDEIAFNAQLIELGDWDVTTTYREGNIVAMPDKTRWLYVATTPSAGQNPESTVGYWELLTQGSLTLFDQTTPPTANAVGDLWTNSTTGQVTRWNGAAWVPISDITGKNQVLVEMADKTILASSAGAIVSGQLPAIITPTVTRGGADIRTDTGTSYAVSGASGGIAGAGVVTVSNAAGATKGQVTISTGMTGNGAFDLTVTVGGIAYTPVHVTVTQANAAPPTGGGGGGGGGTKTASADATGASAGGSFAAAVTLTGLTVASGETIHATAPLGYTYAAPTSGSGAVQGKWQYATAGTSFASPTDFGSAITGGSSTFDSSTFDATPASGNFNQNVTPAAGTYDVRLMLVRGGAGSGGCSITNGTAAVSIS